jgi:predicted phosphodiesterase
MNWKSPLLVLSLMLLGCGGGGGGTSAPTSGSPHNPDGNSGPPDGSPNVFLVKPYLQLGADRSTLDRLALLWHADDGVGQWQVEWRPGADSPWLPVAAPQSTLVEVNGGPNRHRVWSALLAPLGAASVFDYRVLQAAKVVFRQAAAKALPGTGQPQRVAVVGDLTEGNAQEKAIANQMLTQQPDYVVTAGDLAYDIGSAGNYRQNFFPAYNSDPGNPSQGAPLMRSTLMVGAVGNHDVDNATRTRSPKTGSMAYYYYWDQPLNGPDLVPNKHMAMLDPVAWAGFLSAAGGRYPRMGSFSFDVSGVHWTILDSNPYVDWTDPVLVRWVDQDLAAAHAAQWRIVVYHHPSFFQWSKHLSWGSARMRTLWPTLTKHNVDLVFTGHIHAYQRSTPVTFQPGTTLAQFKTDATVVPDTAYAGTAFPKPQGPIHILTGAGGAHLHGGTRVNKPYLAKGDFKSNSFSFLEIQPNTLLFKQIDAAGTVLDSFTIQR